MNFYAVSALVNVATSVVLGTLIFLADKKSAVNRLFAAFAASVAFWSYAYFTWQIAPDAATAIFWTHVLMAGAILITPIYFHFSMRFLGLEEKQRWLIRGGYAFILAFSVINWLDGTYIQGVRSIAGFSFWPIAGPLFWLFLVAWVLYAVLPVLFFFRALRISTEERQRSAIRYMLAGTIIGYAGGCTNYFLWYGVLILPIGNISASIYLALVAYAIMRYRLFNMKLIATELLVFSLWLFVFARMIISSGQDQLIEAALLGVLLVVGVLLIRSVDSEVEQKERIEKLAQELAATNERQEGLIHFISHEVKGFLTKDMGAFATLDEGDLGPMPDLQKDFVARALAQTRDGVASITDILKASNLKKGTVEYKKVPFSLSEVAKAVIEKEKPLAEKKGLMLTYEETGDSFTFTGDATEIGDHVLRNLVDNAVNYTPTGGIHVSLIKQEGKYRFAVKDTGVGITEEDRAKLFTEGGHGKDSQKVNVHSTGYGLYIAKQIAVAHGGSITAFSEGSGKGSTFTLELPAA